jgi:hypothetical protein
MNHISDPSLYSLTLIQIDSQIIIDNKLYYMNEIGRKELAEDKEITLTSYRSGETAEPYVDAGCDNEGCCGNDYFYKNYEFDKQLNNAYLNANKHILESKESADSLSIEDRYLLPPYVHGFVLLSRKWQTFNIDLVEDLTYTDGFDDLVLEPGHKENVLALVKNHLGATKAAPEKRSGHMSMDLVRNKGKGLIILLHGPPG